MADLDRLRGADNLRRAWRWIRSNPDATYKSYFRNLYRNYAVAEDGLLADLADRLRRGIYRPTQSCKLFFPKPSGILRPYSLLTVEDQIVYQSAVNIVAEKLYPRVRSRYQKQVFGHLYAGKSSAWFYRKWSDGYKAFNDSARNVFAQGFVYTACFDLTACYDSLDHGVLRYFLEKIGLDPEFCKQLTDWLEVWTATDRGIFHNHGIPQGPLPSGLLSEVVLSHFDLMKERGIDFHYFRYVDDIRLFAKSRKDLRRLLVGLDLLSKDVGLFPQSSKIRIRQVKEIEKELKSVSNPPEALIKRKFVDQKKLFKRIVQLTPRYKILDLDLTRFKYLLAHADPSAALTARLWRILENYPDIYKTVCNYLRRYSMFPSVPSEKIVEIIKTNTLYDSVRAEYIDVANGRLPKFKDDFLANQLKKQWSPTIGHPDLLARVGTYLLHSGNLSARQIEYSCKAARSWWTRAMLIDDIEAKYVGETTLNNILNAGIKDYSHDVALAAAWKAYGNEVKLTEPRKKWNSSGAILLKEVGVISRKSTDYCGIDISFKKFVPKIPTLQWKRLFGVHHSQAERQAVDIAALSGTNITAFVNALDVFNDLFLDALFAVDGKIGTYTLGNIGSILKSSSSRFAFKFPKTYVFVKEVHNSRYESMYSHPRIGKTKKPTKKIRYQFLGKAKSLLRNALLELSAAGF